MNFIVQKYISDLNLCDEIIEHFKSSEKKYKGVMGSDRKVNVSKKDSMDLVFEKSKLSDRYLIELQKIAQEYVNLYEFSNGYFPWRIMEGMNIQHYSPGQGFYDWHTERCCPLNLEATRHLVFMTYLNDVTDGGETEWYYQKFKVQPRKGLTVIWPADWTHTHRGITSSTQDKYILTGWYNYITFEKNEEIGEELNDKNLQVKTDLDYLK